MANYLNLGHVMLALLLAITFFVKPIETISYCPTDWVEYNYACFYYNPTLLNYADAENACGTLFPGAHLAIARDLDENMHIMSMRPTGAAIWLGYNTRNTTVWETIGHADLQDHWPCNAFASPPANMTGKGAVLQDSSWQWLVDDVTALKPSVCMFYTHLLQLGHEMFVTFSRLHGAIDWSGYSDNAFLMEDGQSFNATQVTGPTGLAETAVRLPHSSSAYISFANVTTGVNYLRKDFYFMFYVYLTANSVGPIIQYRYNQTHYGFNIWSYGNGSLMIDFVSTTLLPEFGNQVFVPQSCLSLNRWTFVTVNYLYSSSGTLLVWTDNFLCLTASIGPMDIEMSRGFDIGLRHRLPENGSDIYLGGDSSFACLFSGISSTLKQFYIAEAQLWCQQTLQETTVDKTMSKRTGVVFTKEDSLIGMWPLNNFHQGREAVGRLFSTQVSSSNYGFGPQGQTNGSLIFDGLTTYVSLNGQPNQGQLAASMTFLRKSFTISGYIFMTTTDGGPLFSFGYDWGNPLYTTTVTINSATDVIIVLPNYGGDTIFADHTFVNCTKAGQWQFLSVIYDYPNGALKTYVNGVQCGTTQAIGQADIEASTNIVVGRTSSPPSYFKGKVSCFSVYALVLSTTEMLDAMHNCEEVLSKGVVYNGFLYKPEHLRLFLPLGKSYGVQDISGRRNNVVPKGRLASGTGPLGHPYSSTKFLNEPNGGIDINTGVKENQWAVGTNDSITIMAYIYAFPNRDGFLTWTDQTLFGFNYASSGFQLMLHQMSGIYYVPCSRGRCLRPVTANHGLNMHQWHWLVLRLSKVTRRLTVSLDGKVIIDDNLGWIFTNFYSPLTLGYRTGDQNRFTGKMACFMTYDTDLHDDEIAYARQMCHAALTRAHGPVMDTKQCRHTSGGWEYTGTISTTISGDMCKSWLSQSDYPDPLTFPDKSMNNSYCRNPEFSTAVRSAPWCYTLNGTWDYCSVPLCPQASIYPMHKPEDVLGYWPLGRLFGGQDVSGHDSHAGVGDTLFVNGPNITGVNTSSATFFKNTATGHYWVQYGEYANTWDLLDLGNRGEWLPGGYSYHIFAKFSTSFTGSGAIWSWESNFGDGGTQGILFSFASGNKTKVTVVDYYVYSSHTLTCSGLVDQTWYQFTLVFNRDIQTIQLYRDNVVCDSWTWDLGYWQDGLYAYSGSFKFGRQQSQVGSNVALSCASIYMSPLTPFDIAVIKQKCYDALSGVFNDILLEPVKPVAVWPMSAQTQGFNSRGPNHARYAMTDFTRNVLDIPQAAMTFPGNNLQYFWAFQDYMQNMDVCSQSRSFAMSAYSDIKSTGTLFSFQTSSTNNPDDTSLLGRGNILAFQTTQNDLFFSASDGGNLFNPIKTGAITSTGWAHVTVSYDYPSDNFYMFINGSLVYNQVNARFVYCQTSGSVSLARSAARPLTINYPANALQGSVSCAQLYSRGFQSEESVVRSQRYCSHPDFIGCYPGHVAGSSDFTLNPGYWSATTLTVKDCRIQCGRADFRYAALRDGSICMCSNTYGTDGPEAPEMCNLHCPGNVNDWCGGANHYNVYRSIKTRVVVSPEIKSAEYANCLPGWFLRGSNCYRVFATRLAFTDASNYCHSFGGQLASVADYDENNLIAAIAPRGVLPGDYICLGINSTIAGQYKGTFTDGSPFFFANWASGQPSYKDYWGCMLASNKLWYAQSVVSPLYFACKKPITPYTDFVAETGCLAGWTRYNDECFIFRKDLATYAQAKDTCNNYLPKSSLAKVTTFSQYMAILNITDLQRPFWLGLEYLPQNGSFFWISDNTSLGYSMWAGDEVRETTTRRCVYADSRTSYFWRAAECDGTRRFAYLCQYQLQPGSPGTIGLGSGRIIDGQLTNISGESFSAPKMGRLNNPDDAFCANDSTGLKLVIDLRSNYTLQELWLQGSPVSSEWVKELTLEYSTNGGLTWTYYTYTTAQQHNGSSWTTLTPGSATSLIPGSNSHDVIVKHSFATPIVANKIRLSPTQYQSRPCMRVEFYGQVSPKPLLDLAFKPIRFELARTSGTSVRYNASVYTFGTKQRLLQHGITERVTGNVYIYRPRIFGRQRVQFDGIDSEGTLHELNYDLATGTRMTGLVLNMCPSAVIYGNYAACEVRVIGGSDVSLTTDYGFEVRGPRRLTASHWEVGTTTPSGSTSGVDQASYVYLMPNQLVKQNGTVYAIEATIATPGWISVQVYKPSCSAVNTYFCPICHCCIALNATCVKQRAFDAYQCGSGYTKEPIPTCSIGGTETMQTRSGFFTTINPKVEYKYVTEWRKYFSMTGSQIVYLNETEALELTTGMVIAYHRNSSDDGRLVSYLSNQVKEYSFMDAASNFNVRRTTGFTVTKTSATATPVMHMVKLIGTASIGVSFGRKWANVEAGTQTIVITAQDNLYPDNRLTFTYDLEVHHICSGYEIVFPETVDAARFISFTVPEHNGTKCLYKLDFGDKTSPVYFDYLTRNSTFSHAYQVDGTYNVTLVVWNLVYSSSISALITVAFSIERMSTFIPNPPVHEMSQPSTAVVTFAQASETLTISDMDTNLTAGGIPTITRSFSPCPSLWVSGSQIGADYCYRYFYQYSLPYERADFFCASIGASLFTVASTAELDFIRNVMASSGGTADSGSWSGYTQIRDDFQFWAGLESKGYLPPPFWQEMSGIYPTGSGKCAYYDYASRRVQNDNCSASRPFVCKREAAVSTFCGPQSGWNYHGATNRCFKVYTALSTYLAATTTCRQIGAQLAVPETNASFSFIQNLAKTANPSLSYYLAVWRPDGLNWRVYDRGNEYTPVFTNFDSGSGQPSNGQGENCVAMHATTGLWRSVACSDMDGFVCEKPIYGTKGTRYTVRMASRRHFRQIPPTSTCEIGWKLNANNGLCYKLFITVDTWLNAETKCNALSAHLATVNSVVDRNFFTVNVINSTGRDVWFGLAEAAAGSWVWADGTDPTTMSPAWDLISSQPISGALGYAYYGANSIAWFKDNTNDTKAYACSKQATGEPKIWAGTCPVGYAEFQGRCFTYKQTADTFANALSACKLDGGGLATFQTAEDFNFVRGLLPVTSSNAWIGLQKGASWTWIPDVRNVAPDLQYTNFWATSQPGGSSGCGIISRSDKMKVIPTGCGTSYPYICEQPAAVCPKFWTQWAGACYRSFATQLHVQPGTEYDTSRASCQYEDSLPLSPFNVEELKLAISLAGPGNRFGLGNRRLVSSAGFSDLWGRRSFFVGQASEPASGNYYAVYNGTAGSTTVVYTTDFWSDASVCQKPSQLDPETCFRQCMATTEFKCLAYMYDGRSCQLMSWQPNEDYYALRESYAKTDIYLPRKDLCPDDLLSDAYEITSTMSTPSATHAQYGKVGFNGFVPQNETTDKLTIDFGNTVWVSGLVVAARGDDFDQFLTQFKMSYTFDRSGWYFYQESPTVDKVFTANTVDDLVVTIQLPKPVLMKGMQIVPVTYHTLPSFRLKVLGCHGAILIDFIDYKYTKPGEYGIMVNAYSSHNNASANTMPLSIQSRILSLNLPQIPPLPFGDWAIVPFNFLESMEGSDPIANGTFNGQVIGNLTVDTTTLSGMAVIAPWQFPGTGAYAVNLTLDNLLVDPIDVYSLAWADQAVVNVTLETNATSDHGALPDETIAIFIKMANCTRCNVSINYGAVNAYPYATYFKACEFIPEYTAIDDIPTVSYPDVGTYTITVTVNNFLPYVKTLTYDVYVEQYPIPECFTIVPSAGLVIPWREAASERKTDITIDFQFTGTEDQWPTTPFYFVDYKDGTTETGQFLPFSSPTPVVNYRIAFVSHQYRWAGHYSVLAEIYNRIGRVNTTATFVIDEELHELSIVPPANIYVPLHETITFNITKQFGSRFDWQVAVTNPDGTVDWSDVFVWNSTDIDVMTFDWTFNHIGVYHLSINGSNFISKTDPTPMAKTIIIQHVVDQNGYRLTANPVKGRLLFTKADDDIGKALTTVNLWINPLVQAPTDPNITLSLGDGGETIPTPLRCDASLASTVDGPWQLCVSLNYTYTSSGFFDIVAVINNLASSRTFATNATVYVGVYNLALTAEYVEDDSYPLWLRGYPRISEIGVKFYSERFFPLGKTVRITATAKVITGMRFCFSSSNEGALNPNDCKDPWLPSLNWVTHKFNYDTPCNSRLETCGITISVIASNPVDTATATIEIYMQKPTLNLKLVEHGPAAENYTYPMYATFDQLGTDVCLEVDYGTNNLITGYHHKQLFGSEFMCSDFYNQEIMAHLKRIPTTDVARKAISLAAQFSRPGYYIVALRARSYIEKILPETRQDLEITRTIIVTRGPCSFPLAFMSLSAKQHYKSLDLVIPGQVLMNCSASTRISLVYTMWYRVNRTLPWTDVSESRTLNPNQMEYEFDGNKESPVLQDFPLIFKATTLPYGFYKFLMEVKMVQEIGLNASKTVEIEVIKSDLVTGLSPPGSRRDLIIFRDIVQMNAYNLSYDPDIGGPTGSKAGMEVHYFCKRDCDGPWPAFTSLDEVRKFVTSPAGYNHSWSHCTTSDETLKLDGFEKNGCFIGGFHVRRADDTDVKWGFPSLDVANFSRTVSQSLCGTGATSDCDVVLSHLDPDSHTLNIDSAFQFENETYNLMAIVIKDNRFAIARQSYRLETGLAPQVLVTAVTNCAYPRKDCPVLNPTSRASFKGYVMDRIPGRKYHFDWQIVAVPSASMVGDLSDDLETALDNYTWAYENWMNMTSTGRKSDDLSLNANLFNGPEYYTRNFMAVLSVVEAGNPRRGLSSVPFYVNTPPDGSNVTCKSNFADGIAMFTLFTFQCSGFTSINGPLSRFVFSVQTCRYCALVALTPTIGTPSVMSGLKLPAGVTDEDYMITIFVDAIDCYDSMTRVKFQVRVRPEVELSDVVKLHEGYKSSVTQMGAETTCQVMFSFGALLNDVTIDPVYTINQTAYQLMEDGDMRKEEDKRVADDETRYEMEMQKLRDIRFNITQWVLDAVSNKSVKADANSVRVCCGVMLSVLDIAEQVAEQRTLSNAMSLIYKLSLVLKDLSTSPTRDADQIDQASSSCLGAAGRAANGIEQNIAKIKEEAKLAETSVARKKRSASAATTTKAAVAMASTRTTKKTESVHGTMTDAHARTQKMQVIIELLQNIALGSKVLRESSTVLKSPGISTNLAKQLVGELSNTVVPSGSPDDCGSFTLGDATIMLKSADPLHGKIETAYGALSPLERLQLTDVRLKSSMSSGNPYAFDSTANGLNSQVQSLVFVNSTGDEIEVHNLPFYIEIMIESKNEATTQETQLKSLTTPYGRVMKSMILNVSAFSALFINVERWNVPNMCIDRSVSQDEIAYNLTCLGNTTMLLYDSSNVTLSSLNVTNEDVIFFVYAKFNETPTEMNHDLACTLPLNAFEDEFNYATGTGPLPTSETVSSDHGAVSVTTPAPITTTPSQIECSTLSVLNVTCCNGSIFDGECDGPYFVPTTPAPTVIKVEQKVMKNCTRPKKQNSNTCFFDHRVVNVMQDSRLIKIGVRAIPRSVLRPYLRNLIANLTTQTPDFKLTAQNVEAVTKNDSILTSKAVRVGYKYHAFSTSCKYFDQATKTWSSDGCYVGTLTSADTYPLMTQCFCNHLTTFSSGFDLPMNMFDPRDSAFTKLDQNPICFTFGICVFCCFFSLLIWARKRDKEDEKKWGTSPLTDNDPRDKYAYELTVWTGSRSNSGTSARVSFILIGDEGETPVHLLDDEERDVLQRGSIDSFLLLTPRPLGKLSQLRIWHDNSGGHPNWYFSRMQVHDLQRNRQYYFLCDRWLAIDEDDGQLERAVPVAGKKELTGFEHLFFTKSRRKLTDGHIWISVFSRPPLSKFTRCQRLTCCLSVLYCAMLANIMFFGIDKDPPGGTRVDLGPITMSLTKIFMSIVSALITIPLNLVIVQLFRMSRHKPTKQERKIEELRDKAVKAGEEERKRILVQGAPAPPSDVNLPSISSDVSGQKPSISPKKSMRKMKKNKNKKSLKLPWWCIIVAYGLAFATCVVCFWAIVEYGGSLGPERAQQWLCAMFISLFSDILVMQPAKILAIALFYALIVKSPTKDEDLEEKEMLEEDEVFIHQAMTEKEMEARRKLRDQTKRDYVFLPPDPEELKQAREQRLKERKMWKIVKEIAFYVMFLYLLMMVAFGQHDDWAMQLQTQMRRVYHKSVLATTLPFNTSDSGDYNTIGQDQVFNNIQQDQQFFTFLERTLIPSVLDGTWYNGDYDSSKDVFTKDQNLFLVGSMRLRQVRVKENNCRTPRNIRGIYTHPCLGEYGIFSEDTLNYTVGWQLAPTTNVTLNKKGTKFMTAGDPRGFAYKTEIDDRGLPFTGALATYNGGGYVLDLGRQLETALEKVAFIKAGKWIDEKTRAVFLEFNLYCPNRNLFAISQTIVEFPPSGSVVLFPYFYVVKVDPYYGTFPLVLLAFEFITLAIVIALFVREIKLAIKFKRQYWTDWWAVLEFFHLLACIIVAIFFMIRYAMSRFVLGDNYKKTHKTGYTNFTIFITYDEIVQSFMACLVFIGFLKMIRLLRFNRRLVIMITTLRHVRMTMLSFFTVFFIVYLAFAQLGYLAFSHKVANYSTFVAALQSLFMMLLGVYDYKDLSAANRFVGPAFFTFFSLAINLFLVNVFVALLMFSYEEVRSDATKLGNDYEMVEFILGKFKTFLGISSKRSTTLSVDKRFAYVDEALHEDEIDKFTSRMDELMTKLDEHLEKTKTQFAALFDQRFLQRKRREVYVTE